MTTLPSVLQEFADQMTALPSTIITAGILVIFIVLAVEAFYRALR